jgi:hypothetical protein
MNNRARPDPIAGIGVQCVLKAWNIFSRGRIGRVIDARTVAALCAAVALGLPTLALSQAQPRKRDPGDGGVTGAIIQFEEKRSSAIVYLEEKGGLASSAPTAVPTGRGEEKVPLQPAPKPKP